MEQGRYGIGVVNHVTMTTAPMPMVHLNGTSRRQLQEGYQNAWAALQNAIEVLAKAELHPRDFYIHPDPNAFVKAREQRDRQFSDLRRIQQEIEAICLHLS